MLEGIGLRFLGFVLDWVADRTNARMRVDAHSGFLMATVGSRGGSSVSHHEARLFVYNAGRHRFTVNQAGWRARNGERLIAHPETPQTIEPGAKEVEYTRGTDQVLAFHGSHGGISHVFVRLAGDKKPKDRRVRKDWIAEVEAVASQPTVTRW